jgi:hypothetical protein
VCPDADGVGGEIGGSVERPGVEGSGVVGAMDVSERRSPGIGVEGKIGQLKGL